MCMSRCAASSSAVASCSKGPSFGVLMSQMSRLYYYKNQFRFEAESGSTRGLTGLLSAEFKRYRFSQMKIEI